MSPKRKPTEQPDHKQTRLKTTTIFKNRDGLGDYIKNPESFPPSVVLYYNDDFVAVHDRYPKSSLHILLLPRDRSKSCLHPFDAFEDTQFLAKVREEIKKLRRVAAAELRRMYGKSSVQEETRREAMDEDPPPDELPEGRDWQSELLCGIHASPSMNNLHIHIISVDRYSPCLKHRKHYNSFATPFFIDLADFPLADDDVRRHPGREGYMQRDLKCWRCGMNFGNKFTRLKDHLEQEYEKWKVL